MTAGRERSNSTLSEKLDWRPGRWALVALLVGVAALSGSEDTLAGRDNASAATARRTADVTDSALGRLLAAHARGRLAEVGEPVERGGLRVLRDDDGYLVVPRGTTVRAVPGLATSAAGVTLAPVVGPERSATVGRQSAAVSSAWVFAGGGCFERISDGWSWLDHCARIYRLIQDGDPQRDFYALQRYGTAGANMPWVLKEAVLGSEPVESSPPMAWQDWNPRSDRSGPCQTITVRVTTPLAGVSQAVDRCETWDITKGATGGDYSLEWSGCACAQDRAIAYVLSISVPQGTLPAWYVPAEVHGFAF